MDKNRIFLEAKDSMCKILNSMDLSNYKNTKETINNFFDFIESLAGLPNILVIDSNQENTQEEIKSQTDENFDAELESPEKEVTKQHNDNIYILDRKLKGGYLRNTNIRVSESVIRYQELEHGDKLSYVMENGKPEFYLIEKSHQADPLLRRQIDFALIEKDGNLLVARNTTNSGIKINDIPYSFLISDKDIQEYNLRPGDIVDIAYYENKPESTSRVIWKHYIDVKQPHKASVSPIKEIKKDEPKKPIEPLLEGVSVLVIGCEFKKSHFQQKVEQHKGIFDWADGNETLDRIKSKVRKADFVIFIKRFINHPKGNEIKNMCKQYHVPFSQEIENFSPEKVVEEALRLKNEYSLYKAE